MHFRNVHFLEQLQVNVKKSTVFDVKIGQNINSSHRYVNSIHTFAKDGHNSVFGKIYN